MSHDLGAGEGPRGPGVALDPRREPAYEPTVVLAGLGDLATRLEGRERDRVRFERFRRAAVLVPLVDGRNGPELIFTVRASHLPHHAGQIAFPGGGLEPGEDLVDAALRETREEIGIDVARDAVLGMLDDHPSPAGYVATPVVARIQGPVELVLDRNEVEEWFTAPLIELAQIPARSELRRQETFQRRIHSFQWNDRRIWGFTGNVVKNLLDVLVGRTASWDR